MVSVLFKLIYYMEHRVSGSAGRLVDYVTEGLIAVFTGLHYSIVF